MSICLSKSNTNVSVLLGTPKRRKNIFTNLTFSGLEQRWVCGNHDTTGQTLVDDLLMCSLYIDVLLRYTIFASVFQFILPLLIIASIYALICRYLRVRTRRSTQRIVITESALYWLKEATITFTFRNLLKHCALWMLPHS